MFYIISFADMHLSHEYKLISHVIQLWKLEYTQKHDHELSTFKFQLLIFGTYITA